MTSSQWPLWIQFAANFTGNVIFMIFVLWVLAVQIFRPREDRNQPIWHSSVLPIAAISIWLVIAPAYHAAWSEKRVGVAFVKLAISHALYYGALLLSLAIGLGAGWVVGARVRREWIGWTAGIAVFLVTMMQLDGSAYEAIRPINAQALAGVEDPADHRGSFRSAEEAAGVSECE